MKAIILAAGEGKRMRPLTLVTPKPMIEILGKPLLHHIIDSLPEEITELIIVIGYKGDAIKKYFGDRFPAKGGSASGGEGRPITYVFQEKQMGTGHALELCKSLIQKGERFLFMIGDDLHSPLALKRLLNHPFAMLVHEHPDPSRFGVVEVDSKNVVVKFEEKPEKPKSNLVSPAVFVLDDRIFNYPRVLHRTGEFFAVDQINQMMKDVPLVAEKSDFWHPVGYPHDIDAAEEILMRKHNLTRKERHDIPLIILAGGRGTRISDEEKDRPKMLVDIGGKPLLQHQIEMALGQGFTNVILALGHKSDEIIAWLKKNNLHHIKYVVEDKPLGTGGAIKFATKGIKTPFIAINGDDIADVNYTALVRHGAERVNVVTGMEIGDVSTYGLLECDEFKKVCSFREKQSNAGKGLVNIGHYYLLSEIFYGTPEVFSIEHDLFPNLAKEGKLVLMKHMGNYWFGCGTPEILKATREYFSKSH